jgi:3-phosphoglycerate kinase
MKTLKELDLKNKKIILRCDFNVPVENGKVVENERIDEALRTIDYILDQGPKMLLLVSHFGRPGGKKVPETMLLSRNFQNLPRRSVWDFYLKKN